MLKVLLIEQSATIRHILENVLVDYGYSIETASDFTRGLELIDAETILSNNYDAFLIGWPTVHSAVSEMLLQVLFEDRFATKPILILAHDTRLDVKRWVSKNNNTIHIPWRDYKQSGEILAKHHQRISTAESDTDLPTAQPIRILFVDDSRTVRFKYKTLLTDNGYHVEIADSVKSGFKLALNSDLDVAIIDYFMPGANGDELCKKLLDHPRTNSITCALITGTYIDDAIESSLKSGAVECMFKNESEALFLARVDAMSRYIRTRKSIEKERTRLGGILHSVGDGVFGVAIDGTISFVNPACRKILGFDERDSLIGKNAHHLFHYADRHNKPIDKEDCCFQNAYKSGKTIHGEETLFWNKSGHPVPVECTVYPFTIDNKREGSVVAFRDISERKTLETRLRWQADHDPLTKLHNRRSFERELNKEIDRLKRSDDFSALIYIDLDRFKHVNDTAGHAAGDQLLIEISQLLASRLRKTDMLARLGGDEFAIILRYITLSDVQHTAEEYRHLLEQYIFYHEDKQYNINASIGIASMDDCVSDSESALSHADLACNIAKKAGRNQIHLYQPETDLNEDKDLNWSALLTSALENDLFLLHCQSVFCSKQFSPELLQQLEQQEVYQLPALAVSDTQVLELLLRLQDNDQEIIHPNAFLPTAERFNMMDKIDPWVVKNALAGLHNLQENGYQGKLSINLSGQTVAEPHVVDIIENLLVKSEVDASKIIFEISETAAAATSLQTKELIYRLNNLGCLIALDDFGSGFFSFAHLKQLPVDFIKIASNLVLAANNSRYNQAIIKSINNVAHSLNISTIARDVENIDTLKLLIESGIDYVQGYFISKPESLRDIVADAINQGKSVAN